MKNDLAAVQGRKGSTAHAPAIPDVQGIYLKISHLQEAETDFDPKHRHLEVKHRRLHLKHNALHLKHRGLHVKNRRLHAKHRRLNVEL